MKEENVIVNIENDILLEEEIIVKKEMSKEVRGDMENELTIIHSFKDENEMEAEITLTDDFDDEKELKDEKDMEHEIITIHSFKDETKVDSEETKVDSEETKVDSEETKVDSEETNISEEKLYEICGNYDEKKLDVEVIKVKKKNKKNGTGKIVDKNKKNGTGKIVDKNKKNGTGKIVDKNKNNGTGKTKYDIVLEEVWKILDGQKITPVTVMVILTSIMSIVEKFFGANTPGSEKKQIVIQVLQSIIEKVDFISKDDKEGVLYLIDVVPSLIDSFIDVSKGKYGVQTNKNPLNETEQKQETPSHQSCHCIIM